jgi:hypothetical protein
LSGDHAPAFLAAAVAVLMLSVVLWLAVILPHGC